MVLETNFVIPPRAIGITNLDDDRGKRARRFNGEELIREALFLPRRDTTSRPLLWRERERRRDGGSAISRQPKRESLLWDLMVVSSERIPVAPDIARYRECARATRPYADAGPAAARGNSLPNAVLARKYSHRLVITLTGEFKFIVNSGGKEKKKKGRETVLDDLIVKP